MITKGIIKSIDFNGNSCIVRMPYFETAGSSEVVCEALVSNTPGVYNGYKENDVVWVAFEDGHMESPVVLGKLYLGASKEKQDPRGTVNCVDSTISGTATIPNDTKLKNDLDYGQINTTIPYYSLSSLANNLQRVDIEQGQNNRDLGNKLRTVVDGIGPDGSKLYSLIEQTDARLTNEVGRKVDTDSGTKEQAFGWDLTANSWKIFARGSVGLDEEGTTKVVSIIEKVNDHNVQKTCVIINGVNSLELNEADKTALGIINDNYSVIKSKCVQGTPNNVWEIYNSTDSSKKITTDVPAETKEVLTATTNGLEVNGSGTFTGDITASTGYIGKFVIGEEHSGDSGIHSTNYIDSFDDIPSPGTTGVYVGTDGIKLGTNFSVDPSGNLIAANVTLTGTNNIDGYVDSDEFEQLSDTVDGQGDDIIALQQGKSTNYYSPTNPSPTYTIQKGDCWFDTSINNQKTLKQWNGNAWVDIGGELVASKVTATFINALDITAKKLTVTDEHGVVFKADADAPDDTQIGGFNVTSTYLSTGPTSIADTANPGLFLNSTGIGFTKTTSFDGHVSTQLTTQTINNVHRSSLQIVDKPYLKTSATYAREYKGSFTGDEIIIGRYECDDEYGDTPWYVGSKLIVRHDYDSINHKTLPGYTTTIINGCNIPVRYRYENDEITSYKVGVACYLNNTNYFNETSTDLYAVSYNVSLSMRNYWNENKVPIGAGALNGTWTGTLGSSSDWYLKKNIEDLSNNYDIFFDNLKPVRFKYKDGTSGRYHTGLIAQEVVNAIQKAQLTEQEVAAIISTPITKEEYELISKDTEISEIPEQIYAIRYTELVALNIDQVQKLKKRVADLEAKLAKLEKGE